MSNFKRIGRSIWNLDNIVCIIPSNSGDILYVHATDSDESTAIKRGTPEFDDFMLFYEIAVSIQDKQKAVNVILSTYRKYGLNEIPIDKAVEFIEKCSDLNQE